MKDKVKVIIFDADDTLWDNQTYFDRAEDVFTEELKEYGTAEELSEELYKTESANMPILGYGAKAVCISMMETALKVSDHKVPGENLSRILSSAKSLLRLPATPFPGVAKTLDALDKTGRYRLILMTKGDMLDQQNKIRRSGLDKYFYRVIVVTKKGIKEYLDISHVELVPSSQIAVVGNSFKSPADHRDRRLRHPYSFHTMWRYEVTEDFDHPNITRLDSFEELTKIFH